MSSSGSFKLRIHNATSTWQRRTMSTEHEIGGFLWCLYARREPDETGRSWLECCLCCIGEANPPEGSAFPAKSLNPLRKTSSCSEEFVPSRSIRRPPLKRGTRVGTDGYPSFGGSEAGSIDYLVGSRGEQPGAKPEITCPASFFFSLVSLTGDDLTEQPIHYTFTPTRRGRGTANCFPWEEVVDPSRGFLVENTITISVHVEVRYQGNPYRRIQSTFDFPTENTDLLLIVEEKKVFVSKAILALHSSVFAAMAVDDEANNNNDIVLPNVNYNEFLDFLRVIYPERKKVNDENVEHLLKLAEKFDAPLVLEKCEKFLLKTSEVCLSKKLLYADRYQLTVLMERSLGLLDSPLLIGELSEMSEFESYDETLLRNILMRLL